MSLNGPECHDGDEDGVGDGGEGGREGGKGGGGLGEERERREENSSLCTRGGQMC